MQLFITQCYTARHSNDPRRTKIICLDKLKIKPCAPRLNANAAQDIRQVIDRYDRSCEQKGLKETNRAENNQLHTMQGDSELITDLSYFASCTSAAGVGPAGVLAQPILRSTPSALTCSIGAYSAASGNIAQKLVVAAKGFVASVMQDLRSFGQVFS